MQRVILINMPFASAKFPSPALSILKPLVEKTGVGCDVAYLNILFQAACGGSERYEGVADFLVIGETVFGAELFGEDWSQSDRGRLDTFSAPLMPDGINREAMRQSLLDMRPQAGEFLRECLRTIKWQDYDIVGFTSVYSQNVAALALAQQIKQRWPDKIVAFGGANCEEDMGAALLRLFPFVDWVFNGEADLSFPQAVVNWFNGKPPAGLSGVAYRSNGEIVVQGQGQSPQMDDLPYPDFDDYFKALNQWAPDLLTSAPISLELSRGCWWGKKSQCIFCGLNCHSMNYRRKSPGRAESEIKELTARYHVAKVILTDSILDMSYFKTLLPRLAEWGRLDELFLESRSNLTRDQVRMLSAAGVKLFQPGVESLDSEMLAYMGKGTTLLQNVQFLKWALEYELYPTWNLLYGFPNEPAEAYRRMHELIPSIVHLFPPLDVSPVLLVRFSPLFEQYHKWHIRNLRAHKGYQSVYPYDSSDLDALAYFFDFDWDGQDKIPVYIDPLKKRVRLWQQLWAQSQPPILTEVQTAENKIMIYDTRSGQNSHRFELQGPVAAAYRYCDTMRPFEAVAGEMQNQWGPRYGGDDRLRRALDKLVAHRYMLKENDDYLSLAVRPGPVLDVSEEW
ncbi:MAG: RiPP maturation radical SAM C-methyltransferase [Deltaproteobacteria bacterium]|jgi:ribosomal peptide maturation radical SAM protein 1|nr:RiPP maturation radical SAM C-methyltransferase [Deltaproteobacteria bacterium]